MFNNRIPRKILLSPKVFLSFSLLLFCFQQVSGQASLAIRFGDSLLNLKEPAAEFVVFTYKYKSDTVYYSGLPHIVKPPSNYNKSDCAFGFIQFEEHGGNAIPSYSLFFIDNYSQESKIIYVDTNFNLDFTDETRRRLDSNSDIAINLINKINNQINVRLRLKPILLKDKGQESILKSFARTDIPISINNELLTPRYWMTELRYNYKTCIDYPDIAIMDFNNNGRFDDYIYDKILISDSIGKVVRDVATTYKYNFGIDTLISFRGNNYLITNNTLDGNFVLKLYGEGENNAATRLKVGSVLPNFKFTSFDGHSIVWADAKQKDKYMLIDFWGTWCKPCLAQTKDLIELKSKYSGRLEILSLAFQENKDNAKRYVKSKNLNWIHGFATKDNIKEFEVLNFPYYILVDPNGIIITINSGLETIEALIK